MIVVEPCAYKLGTAIYAENVIRALQEKNIITFSVLVTAQPATRFSFILHFVKLYFKVRSLQRKMDCSILYLSVEPTIFPLLNFFFPIKGTCFVKFGGYELRMPVKRSLKLLLIRIRILLWRTSVNIIKITETQMVASRLKYFNIKNVLSIFHPVCSKIEKNSKCTGEDCGKLLYFGHRPKNDKNTYLVLELAKNMPELELCIAGYEEDPSVDEMIQSYLSENNLQNVIYDNSKVSEEEKATLFDEFPIVVLPYRKDYDGGSGVFFDALRFGSKIVAAEVGEFAQLLSSRSLGQLFKADDLASLIEATKAISSYNVVNNSYERARDEILKNRSFDKFVASVIGAEICKE